MANIPVNQEQIADFCRKYGIRRLSFFGSVLRPDFRPDSDVDVLVEFDPQRKPSLLDLVRMQNELEHILGRPVDLVEYSSIEQSRNYLRRREILNHLEVAYAAG